MASLTRRHIRIEKQKIEELHKHNRYQLWNTADERLIGITWEKYNGNKIGGLSGLRNRK